MGFLDKAKEKISGVYRDMSEETVRNVDYDEIAKQKAEKAASPAVEEVKSEKAEKPAKTVKPPRQEKVKKETVKEKPKPKPPSQLKPKITNPLSKISIPKILEPKEKAEVKPKEDSKSDENDQKVKDILEVLAIAETFELPSNVLLPEDFDNIKFDMQVPKGYDIGQVNSFIEQVISSSKHFVKLLKTRNVDIAKLATTIDRLQVDLNNVKFDANLASGINIMPSDSDENFEEENISLKIENRRLKELLKQSEDNDTNESDLEEKDNELQSVQDQLSIERRNSSDLEKEIYSLRNRLAYFEEHAEYSDDDDSEDSDSQGAFSDDDEDDNIPGFSETFGQGLEAFPKDDGQLPESFESTYNNSEDSFSNFYSSTEDDSAFSGVDSDPVKDLFDNLPKDENDSEDEGFSINFNSEEFSNEARLKKIQEEEDSDDFLDSIMNAKWDDK